MILHLAIRKYGKENFSIKEIAKVETIQELNELEEFLITELNTLKPIGYNIKSGGCNSFLDDEIKIKIGKSNSGKIRTQQQKTPIVVECVVEN